MLLSLITFANPSKLTRSFCFSLTLLFLQSAGVLLAPNLAVAGDPELVVKCQDRLNDYTSRLEANPSLAFFSDFNGDPKSLEDPIAPQFGTFHLVYEVFDNSSVPLKEYSIDIPTEKKVRHNKRGQVLITDLKVPTKKYPVHEPVSMLSTHKILEAVRKAKNNHPENCIRLRSVAISFEDVENSRLKRYPLLGIDDLNKLPSNGFPVGHSQLNFPYSPLTDLRRKRIGYSRIPRPRNYPSSWNYPWSFTYLVSATKGYLPVGPREIDAPTTLCYSSFDPKHVVSCSHETGLGAPVSTDDGIVEETSAENVSQ